jgi:hypothetical protein
MILTCSVLHVYSCVENTSTIFKEDRFYIKCSCFFFSFFGAGDWTQGLMLLGQPFTTWAVPLSAFVAAFVLFQGWNLATFVWACLKLIMLCLHLPDVKCS